MEDVFRKKRQSNSWDNLIVDVQDIYERFPIGSRSQKTQKKSPTSVFFKNLYKTPLLPLNLRRYFRKIARQINLDLGWFQDFSQYWTTVLGGRPFWGVQDFYFLMNLYRVRFQDSQIPDTDDASMHLSAWQKPEILYQLLHLVYKETSVDYAFLIKIMFKHYPQLNKVLEFGCGTAPITASLIEFFGSRRKVQTYFSDIQTIAFHYAAHRFAYNKNAIPLLLVPENGFALPETGKLDVVTCITVFEHLNRPLETIKDFHMRLVSKGLLIFDYIKSDGDGLDTFHGVREREVVLDFVAQHFDVLQGDLSNKNNIGLVVARKK